MAIRRIINGSDPILYKKSREVTVFDSRLHQLLEDLADTLHDIGGAGLAAVQVGVLRKVCVIDVGEGVIELVNPVIVEQSEDGIEMFEGCLSFPGESGWVARPRWVKVQAQDRHGSLITLEGEELLARAFCHEIDHLHGIVFKEHASEIVTDEELERRRREESGE